jgi:hypothetical protein
MNGEKVQIGKEAIVFYLKLLYRYWPVPIAARSKTRTVFKRSNTRIVGSNSSRGIDVCPRFSVLCCPV